MDIPCLYNAETASILFLSMPGVRPNLAPLRRASLRPAEHLSAITERSNSAKAAINDIISFPVAELPSIPSCIEIKEIPL